MTWCAPSEESLSALTDELVVAMTVASAARANYHSSVLTLLPCIVPVSNQEEPNRTCNAATLTPPLPCTSTVSPFPSFPRPGSTAPKSAFHAVSPEHVSVAASRNPSVAGIFTRDVSWKTAYLLIVPCAPWPSPELISGNVVGALSGFPTVRCATTLSPAVRRDTAAPVERIVPAPSEPGIMGEGREMLNFPW